MVSFSRQLQANLPHHAQIVHQRTFSNVIVLYQAKTAEHSKKRTQCDSNNNITLDGRVRGTLKCSMPYNGQLIRYSMHKRKFSDSDNNDAVYDRPYNLMQFPFFVVAFAECAFAFVTESLMPRLWV